MKANRHCLCDNDWLIKLACFDLLDDAFKSLKVPPKSAKVLGTCERVTCSPAKRTKYGEQTIHRIRSLLRHAKPLADHEIDDAIYVRVFTHDLLDGGETQLFSATIPGDNYICTDDKRAMVELARRSDLQDIHKSHLGRVVCVEKVVLLVIENRGFDYVDKRVRHYSWADDKVNQAWAGGNGQSAKHTIEVLRHHIGDLQKGANGLLLA